MKFFIPAAEDAEQAERVYKATKSFAEEQMRWETTGRRIFRIEYTHEGKQHSAEIGQHDPRIGETVIAILETLRGVYFVCSANRSVLRGSPMLVGSNEIRTVTDFED
jgi:hypothetical protein